jgi:general secretion pathway protein D
MTIQKRAAAALLVAAVLLGGCVASRAFRDAEREEAREHWDVAVLAYEKALAIEPTNIRYKIALSRARQRAARAHYERGKLHHGAGQLDMAAVELEQSVALDPTNDSALQDLKKVQAEIEARRIDTAGGTPIEKAKARARGVRATPPMLVPSSTKPISLSFPQETPIKRIYQFLASAAGINVIYDPQLKDDKFSIELRDVSFQKALETVMRQAGHFYKVIDEKTILIAQDTNQNRKEYEDLVIRTFFLSNGDIKDVSAMVRSLLDLRRLGTIPALNAIVIRDTADKVAVAERIIDINDKAKAEVVVDVELLQLDTQKALTLGAELSQYSTTGSLAGSTTTSTNGGTNTTTGNTLPWRQLFRLGLNDFNFTVPSLTFNFYKDNLDAEVLAKPQLRIEEGEKAQLVIGNRVPIPVTTVNTTQAIGQVGVVPITSFQYQEVGIKIDLEPRVHHNKEVTLKLTVEVSNLNGSVSGPNGQQQPIIGTRTITSTIRLKDGETNILAGLIRRDSTKEKLSVPFLGDIPLIGQLFSKHSNTNNNTDLFLTLTPHIIRAPSITEDDLLPVWVGTENNVSFSGLNTRLESPTAPGSPFDAAPGTVRPPVVNPGLRGQQPAPTPFPIAPGTAPRDIFKNPVIVPTPAPPKQPAQSPDLGARSAPDDGTKSALALPLPAETPAPSSGPTLALASSADAIAAGQTGTVTLNGLAGLAEAGALELTLEWDPNVAEVTSITPGPWQSGPDGPSTRFEADRTPGRARLQLARPVGSWGLPTGVLAELSVRGVAPGTTLFRVSAAAGAAKTGGVAPTIQSAALTVGQ